MHLSLALATLLATAPDTAVSHVRINQLGYRPADSKVAVVCSLQAVELATFTVHDEGGRRVLGPLPAQPAPGFGPCAVTHRLDFSALRAPGRYHLLAGQARSPLVRVAADVYDGAADSLLVFMRQQRSGYNPFFRTLVHQKDGIVVDHPTRTGDTVQVSGGWADAADYLQYVTTSATATYQMLLAYRDHPEAFGDAYDARGLPGANGVPDVLDEARHGLDWLSRMYADDDAMFNQLGDDRDHAYWDLLTTDSSDYGWGRGGPRPVYPCTGRPQGLFQAQNRATGKASTAGKYAAAFALGARLLPAGDSALTAELRRKAVAAYAVGRASPGVCQTAPGTAPYFYEEGNYTDDMELGAAELFALTGEPRYLHEALRYAAEEPVTPWMGADTARHYEWYPWHNNGHYAAWRGARGADRERMASYYRQGLERVVARADNGFRMGVPFIWCSNNLVASLATQAILYRRMTGDTTFVAYENAAVDWLFGANPWGVSMVIGLPGDGVYPRDPHHVVAKDLGVTLTGGLVDGPVYRSIFENLRGIRLHEADEYAPFNSGRMVYHDDLGDYSTNEPIMDGTANLAYLLSARSSVVAADGTRTRQ
ncbi:MAG TPA: glycoside hydrolase family 9 protein [Gemmatimonadaceae bacterium]|nr:glycoside hydrolase family 9 protein [Gemmatimonadaceae bacterium]